MKQNRQLPVADLVKRKERKIRLEKRKRRLVMANEPVIKLFEGKKVRVVWDEEMEKYYFSVVDIVQVLTGSSDYQQARKYWKVLKGRLIKEGNESVTNCYQLKLTAADGKKRLGRSVVSKERASDYILPEQPKKEVEKLPFEDVTDESVE